MSMQRLSDLELLQIEMDPLWGMDAGPELVVACAREGSCARISDFVLEELARHLVAEAERTTPNDEMRMPPARLEKWRILLEDALGAAVLLSATSGPSYLVHDEVTFPATAPLVRSIPTISPTFAQRTRGFSCS
jgi:hypothetical protein